MKWDKSGLQLADVPGSGTSRRAPGQKSGNPLHDTRSGKFGQGGRPARARTPAPANVDPMEYRRMLDAVRDAARKLPTIDEGSITEFIQGRANSPEQVDIANFLAMVEEQRKSDLVDLIDNELRGSKSGKISLKAPRKLLKSLLGSIDSDQQAEIMHRLEGMGHNQEEITRYFEGRTPVHEEATKKRDGLQQQ